MSGARGRRSPHSTAAFAVTALALAACHESPPTSATPSQAIASAAKSAREAHGDPEQIQILDKAASAGEVTYADVKTAYANTLACFDDNGIHWEWADDAECAPGLIAPMHEFTERDGFGTDASLAVAGKRGHAYSDSVLDAFSTQPRARAAREPEPRPCFDLE